MSRDRKGWAERRVPGRSPRSVCGAAEIGVREVGPGVFGLKTRGPDSLERDTAFLPDIQWSFIHSANTVACPRARCRGQGGEWPAPTVPALQLARRGRISPMPEPGGRGLGSSGEPRVCIPSLGPPRTL